MENFIELYNPRNASKLTEEQIQAMQLLTDDQIKALAEAYPNQPTGNAYLKYFDKSEPVDKQRFPLGTWRNLHSLRKLGKTNLVAFAFIAKNAPVRSATAVVPKPAKKVVDLSKNENLEGLKKTVDPNDAAKEDFKDVLNDKNKVVDTADYDTAVQNLEAAKANGAHPQTIKSLQKKVDAAKAAAEK